MVIIKISPVYHLSVLLILFGYTLGKVYLEFGTLLKTLINECVLSSLVISWQL